MFPKLNELSTLQEFVIKSRWYKFWEYLKNEYPEQLSWSERLYWYYNEITEPPKCLRCGVPTKYICFTDGYRSFCCRKCSANDPLQKQKIANTNIKKYGCTTPLANEEIKDKIRATNLERYGVENPQQCEKISKKTRATNLERYGAENPFGSKVIQDKIRAINLERYGVESPQQCEKISKKTRATNLKRYGVENPSKNPEISNKKSRSLRKFRLETMKYKDIILDYTEDGGWLCKCINKNCDKCSNKTFITNSSVFHARANKHIEQCTNILPISTGSMPNKNTSIELFIKNILDRAGVPYISNNRDIIPPEELDIYIPSKNIAIECNGIRWHSDKPIKYHFNKFSKCQSKGIQLLTIWEDQIKTKPEVVESVILSKLGIYNRSIYARCSEVREVDAQESKTFLEKNHLQGSTNASVKLGLYLNNELISMMLFKKISKMMGSKSLENTYELCRFCSLKNTTVLGGASKLLSYFINNYKPSKIISYSSNDISNGGLYKTLGFNPVGGYSISYWYVHRNNMKRYHRTSFTKSKLKKMGYDVNNLTEAQIMNQSNYYKIYDCGHMRYDLDIEK